MERQDPAWSDTGPDRDPVRNMNRTNRGAAAQCLESCSACCWFISCSCGAAYLEAPEVLALNKRPGCTSTLMGGGWFWTGSARIVL